MTQKRAREYLNSLNGVLPKCGKDAPEHDFKSALKVTHRIHFCYKADAGFWCDCKSFFSKKECSHVDAVEHLTGRKLIHPQLQGISVAKLPGRPRKAIPCAYAAHKPHDSMLVKRAETPSANYIGFSVATRFGKGESCKVYIGRISGNSFIHISFISIMVVYLHCTFSILSINRNTDLSCWTWERAAGCFHGHVSSSI